MKELIGKSNDGAFVLTPSGEQELYFITTRKLIQYYLKEGLQKDPVSIAEKMNNLSVFIYSNFQKIEDYLNKLPELANFIGEDNIQRFQKFMGQHFVNTLQKEKAILLKKEIETSKDKLDNPFWTPSSEFINKFGILFSSAPALVWPPVDSKNAAAPTIPEPAAALQNISDTTQIESTAPVAAAVKNKPAPQSPTLTEEPGVAFLKLFSRNFLSAKPLDPLINQEPQTDATTTESSGEDENIPAQPVNSLPVSPAATPKKEIIPILTEMPGETFLKKSGSIFVNSPKLEPDSTSRPMENKHASTAKLFSLKEFASILGNIAKFTRAKDNAGYQNWYSSLPYLSKASIKMNSLINAEKKGTVIDWGKEIMLFAASTNSNKNDLYKLSSEIKLYAKVINLIKQRLTTIANLNLTPQDTSNIYSQSISILSGNEKAQDKNAALKILLLQVANETARETLMKEFEKVIHALK